jgi:hypothetical protein
MEDTGVRSPFLEKMLAWLGLLLLGLLAWACNPQTASPRTARSHARRALARLVIGSVTAVGWIVDHLSPVATGADAGEFSGLGMAGGSHPPYPK